MKLFFRCVGLAVLFAALAACALATDPSFNMGPDQDLYRRVQALGGLLDPEDRALLDEGRIVTRLDLAFFVEKAAFSMEKRETRLAQAPAAENPTTIPQTESAASPGTKAEILELLRLLRAESAALRSRLGQNDRILREQREKFEALSARQEKAEMILGKADLLSASTRLSSVSSIRMESLNLSGLAELDAVRVVNELNVGFWNNLGGKGSLSFGLGAYLPTSRNSSGPVSVYLFSPKISMNLDGALGHWTTVLSVEDYNYDTDLGSFTRGASPGSQRFEDPFNIKKWSGDRNQKQWEDYMSSLSYVPSSTSWTSQGNSTKVFDGIYLLGSQLPYLGPDTKATILLGRMGSSGVTQRWEEAVKISRPWLDGKVSTALSSLWVNDHYGTAEPGRPSMDMRSYAAEAGLDLKPVFVSLEGGASRFFTGVDREAAVPVPITDYAGQISLNLYPFTLAYTDVADGYSNFQSKAVMAGLDMARFGYPAGYGSGYHPNSAVAEDHAGAVGVANDLMSNRRGVRVNLGWKGRQGGLTKSLPALLDALWVNADWARKTEYKSMFSPLGDYTDNTAVPSGAGHHFVEATHRITVYYPEDTGLWGNNIFMGYNATRPVGESYINNLQSIRNDANWDPAGANGPTTRDFAYVARSGGSEIERIPFILPVVDSLGAIQTDGAGRNLYTDLSHRKTFHYLTWTGKLKINKWLKWRRPFYGGVFYTDHRVSGKTTDPTLIGMDDPNRPGTTLESIPDLFRQRVLDATLVLRTVKNLNLMGNFGWESWKSDYTYPRLDAVTRSLGVGAAYDLPWGTGKLEARYRHLTYENKFVSANNYQADQLYTYFLFQF